MGAIWEDQEYDIARIAKEMTAPQSGPITVYRPGPGGFLEKDLTHTAGTPLKSGPAINLGAPGGPQQRLEQLEATYPGGEGALPTYPSGAIPDARAPVERPKYSVPEDMRYYFDEAIKAVTGSSPGVDLLKNRAQGFGLGMVFGKRAAKLQSEAALALKDIENTRRTAIAQLSNVMANLMVEPSRFARDIYGKELEYDLGRRKEALAEKKLGLEAEKLGGESPATAIGIGEGGEKRLYTWNRENKRWDLLSRGAVPVEVEEGKTLIDPLTGKIIGKGRESSKFKENLATAAFKVYSEEMKEISNNSRFQEVKDGDPKKNEERRRARMAAEEAAYNRLTEHMNRLGYGDFFQTKGGRQAEATWKPDFETFRDVVRARGSRLSDEQLRAYYQQEYGEIK